MNYFFETQPNPNPMAYFAHPAPEAWHKFETFGNHVVELVFPFLSFLPFRTPALINGFWQITFQIILISTGNLSFLNWLTILPSMWFFDDKILSKLFHHETIKRIRQKGIEETEKLSNSESNEQSWQNISQKMRTFTSIVIGVILAYLSVPIVQVSPKSGFFDK